MKGGKLILQPIDNFNKAAEVMRVLGHPVRLQIMDILSQGEFAVYEIACICNISHPVACEHLKLMNRSDILDRRRKGKAVYYRVKNKEKPDFLKFMNELYGE